MNLNTRKFLRTPVKVHQQNHLNEKLLKLPNMWGREVGDNYWQLLNTQCEFAANEYLRKVTDPLRGLLDIAADDDDLKDLASELALKVREKISTLQSGFFEYARLICDGYAVPYPDYDGEGIKARLVCDVWWLRNLRNSHAKAREIAAIDAGLVHRHKNIYVSDDTLERRTQQLRRNAALLAQINIESESGQVMKLAKAAAAGVSNHDNRRAELMTRITGFEELANKYGHKAEFVTLTCPSRMHAVTKNGKQNPKYDGTKPCEAQKYLVHCWARARANLHFNGVKFYGLRVAEPHHDGTPHWHLILFYDGKDSTRKKIKHYITKTFIADSRQEIWNDITPRVKFVAINPDKGTAAGYVVKYVSKNIGGIKGEKSDEADRESTSLAGRVEAWASTWRIRQFQQVGGHSVTIWRELRRVTDSVALEAGRAIFTAWQSAQRQGECKASFARFVEAMGGLKTPPSKGLIKLDDDFIYTRGRYGMGIVHKIKGVCERYGMARAGNNRETWVRV